MCYFLLISCKPILFFIQRINNNYINTNCNVKRDHYSWNTDAFGADDKGLL